MANNSQGFVNLYRKPVALVTEKQLQHISEGVLIDEPARNNDDGVAVAMTVEITVGSIGGLNNNIPPVAITTTFSEPKLIKDNRPHNFPDPRDGVLLFVSKEVAEAARDIGRDTDDLVFPKHFYETDTTIYCSRVEKLQS